jgi:glutaredoxin
MQKLLDTDGSPMRNLGKIGEDGEPYIDLKKSTYIVGNIGLNEAVEFLTGKQLHESEDAYETGLRIIAFMYKKIQEFKKKTNLKFTIEETPAESTTRRLAKVDWKRYDVAKKIIKGTEQNPYYTNSIHFAPGAEIGIVERIVGQSKFHDMIESGAIIHAYIGEQRPNKEVIEHLVRKTLEDTRCSQLVFSPTYTECDECGKVMDGEQELCENKNCKNSNDKTLNKHTLSVVTKVVGYNSRVSHWNNSQRQIYEDRKRAELYYAGKPGKDLSWLYKPSMIEPMKILIFGKHNCPYCDKLKKDVQNQIEEMNLNLRYKFYYLDEYDAEGLVESAKYNVPLDSVPTIVIVTKDRFWKKTTENGMKSSCDGGACSVGVNFGKENLIKLEEIKKVLTEFMPKENKIEILNFEVKSNNPDLHDDENSF